MSGQIEKTPKNTITATPPMKKINNSLVHETKSCIIYIYNQLQPIQWERQPSGRSNRLTKVLSVDMQENDR